MYKSLEARKPKGINRITKISLGHLCLREESTKTKGHTQNNQNQLRSPMSEGGEHENQRA